MKIYDLKVENTFHFENFFSTLGVAALFVIVSFIKNLDVFVLTSVPSTNLVPSKTYFCDLVIGFFVPDIKTPVQLMMFGFLVD